MKKFLAIFLSTCLILAGCISFASCQTDEENNNTSASTTAQNTESQETTAAETTEQSSETATEETTTEEETDDSDSQGGLISVEDGIIHISNAEQLYAFNDYVNIDYEDLSGLTISIDADINCNDMPVWEPLYLDGGADDLVIEGNNHTISNIRIVGEDGEQNNGFIGIYSGTNLTIQNLNMSDFYIEAYGQQNAAFIGYIGANTTVDIKNCEVYNLEINGYMDNYSEGHKNIAFRCAGFVGGNFGGFVTIENCRAETLKMTGFHNLAAFVGYDAVDGLTLLDCSALDIDITFSYTESPSYTVTNDHRETTDQMYNVVFVDPFYCNAKWTEHLELDEGNGNTWDQVFYHDNEDPNAPTYTPDKFRSGVYDYDYDYIKD